jgi:preprotein translocase subunit Sec61beta
VIRDSFQKATFVETRILFGKVFRQVKSEDFDSFIFPDGSVLFFSETLAQDVSDGGELFFCHVMILIVFVVIVKLFSQVFCDLVRGRNLQSVRVEQAHLAMMMSVGLVSFVTDNAIDCVATHPELALLWCFLFHV